MYRDEDKLLVIFIVGVILIFIAVIIHNKLIQ